ncbi:MAG: membrane protein [Lysobacteraceae bacterium]|nr:MAG: membrane protein [Xanthomonadaceae bacterium]
MNTLHLVRKNLGRKKVRTLFTGLSIVIAFLLFGLLGALRNSFTLGVELAGADRLITVHKVSLVQLLPISYLRNIQSTEGVDKVAHFTWFGGYYQDPKQQFFAAPTDPEMLFEVYSEWKIVDGSLDAWQRNRTGMLIGQSMATINGWKVGDRLPIGSTIYAQSDGNRSWEFTVEAIFSDGADGANEQALYFHYDYFDEARQFGQGQVGWYVTKVADPDTSEEVARAIDIQFANSAAETKTSTEKGWVQGFAQQFGNIGLIVTSILGAVFFTMLLVAGNTMAQSVRERTSELAVLKTLGFSDARVMRMVLYESLMLAVVAGGIGLLLSVVMAGGMRAAVSQFLPGFAINSDTLLTGVGLIILLGLITGLLPALSAMRLNVVTALARR